MAGVEKLIEKMHNQPNEIRPTEAEKVLESGGYHFIRQKGSHHHYINDKGDLITIKIEIAIKMDIRNPLCY